MGALTSLWDRYSIVPGRGVCVFDPGTMIMGGTMAMSAIGTGLSAAGTIAGGNTAKTAGQLQQLSADYQAGQLRANEGSDIGAAQRQMIDTQQKAKLLSSTLEARGASGGINVGEGSALATEKSIASRGSYQALMDLWNGQNKAVGEENQAKGVEFSGDVAEWAGEQAQAQSRTQALATIAGGAASIGQTYGAFKYGGASGRPGVTVPS